MPEDAPEPVVVRSIAPGTCPECGSVRSKKNGVRYNKNYENQNYRCLDCGKHFSGNAALGNTVLPPPELMAQVMGIASYGTPYSKMAKFLASKDKRVCVKTVCNTVHRFSKIPIEYCGRRQTVPARPDGRRDADTPVGAADPRKAEDDISPMYRIGACWAGKVPHLLISDAAPSFHSAWAACYRPNRQNQKYTDHAAMIHLKGNRNNNMTESLSRELGRRMWAAQFVQEKAAAAMA